MVVPWPVVGDDGQLHARLSSVKKAFPYYHRAFGALIYVVSGRSQQVASNAR